MKVQQSSIIKSSPMYQFDNKDTKNPSFKGGGFLYGTSALMEWIQNTGFMGSFLIQDGLGMTTPRVFAAYMRDKEVTGTFNAQEGLEVLLREGLTGPLMISMAPIVFAISARFGRSTSVNSKLIKRFGKSLKEMLSKPDFDKKILESKTAFKEEFMSKNIREMIANTNGKENLNEESVKYILEQIRGYENVPEFKDKKFFISRIRAKNKYRNQCMSNIEEHLNSIRYRTSSDLDMLNKVKVGSGEDIKAFEIRKTIDAMLKYSDDAINFNKKLADLDAAKAESLMHRSIGKRLAANIATVATTLGVLSYIPKIYARSDVSPGAKTAMIVRDAREKERLENIKNEQKNAAVSFKAKPPKKSFFEKLGKLLSKNKKEDVADHLEYDGNNFTPTLMAVLSAFGLLLPRGLRAVNRAQIDENGNKDKTELYEILIRDLTSSMSVIFAVPMLTRLIVSSYENRRGFVLMHKDREMSGFKKVLDKINPYSKSHVLTNSEIKSLYHDVTTKEKMLNFCKYIDSNNGDLQKILSKSDYADEMFRDADFKLSDIKTMDRKEKNKKITEFIEKLGGSKENSNTKIDESIRKLMQGKKGDIKHNRILTNAKGLNSLPALISTVFISPFILGWIIPRITYANTRRLHDKYEQERAKKVNTAA